MSENSQKTGLAASSALHALVLAFVLVGFAAAPKFEDASETTPVDTITKDQFERMMGERDAKPPPPAPKPEKPRPPQPPQPPQPPPDPRKVEETPAPSPPPPPAPPQKVESAKLPPPPAPPPRPAPPPNPEAMETPQPPVKPRIVDTPPPERPRETPPERPAERPKLDQVARLLAKPPPEEPAKDAPKSTARPYDAKAIAKLVGETKPSPSSASQANPSANPGLPTARAARMSGSQERQLDDWFKDAYMACWSPPPTIPEGDVHIPEVQVTFNADGTLSGQPALVNPPPDPVWRAHAESAVRAALRCNPMKVPSQFAPFFEQWRTKTIHFDPREALG